METYPKPTVSLTALLAAAVVLGRMHGRFYATCFLQDYGIDESVICDLLDGLDTDADRRRYPDSLDSDLPKTPRFVKP